MVKKIIITITLLYSISIAQSVQTLWDDTTNVRSIRDTVNIFYNTNFALFNKLMNMVPTVPTNTYGVMQDFLKSVNIFYESVSAGDTVEVLFIPPSDTSAYRLYATVEINGEKGHWSITTEMSRDSVLTNGGRRFGAGFDREFPTLSRMEIYTDSITYNTGDTLWINRGGAPGDSPQASGGTFVQGGIKFKLSPSKAYSFRLINVSNVASWYVLNFEWFEFIPQNSVMY